jgi:hypothetical protein
MKRTILTILITAFSITSTLACPDIRGKYEVPPTYFENSELIPASVTIIEQSDNILTYISENEVENYPLDGVTRPFENNTLLTLSCEANKIIEIHDSIYEKNGPSTIAKILMKIEMYKNGDDLIRDAIITIYYQDGTTEQETANVILKGIN